MLSTRVMPCLLLRNKSLVKTIKFAHPDYIGDPVNTVRIFNTMEVDELILLDITATPNKRKPPFKLINEIASELFAPLTYGGGINDINDIKELFSIGVEKVSINSSSLKNPALIKQAAENFGSQSILASIDAKKDINGKYTIYCNGGTQSTLHNPEEWAKKMEELGAGELLLTSIDRDGTWQGYDLNLIQTVSKTVNIPVIACGGAGNPDDFSLAVRNGASAVAAGSMFVYQKKDYGVLVNFPDRQKLEQVLLNF